MLLVSSNSMAGTLESFYKYAHAEKVAPNLLTVLLQYRYFLKRSSSGVGWRAVEQAFKVPICVSLKFQPPVLFLSPFLCFLISHKLFPFMSHGVWLNKLLRMHYLCQKHTLFLLVY